MNPSKTYLHDKTIISLLAVNATLFVVACLSVLLRANNSAGETFIVQYRSNLKTLSLTSGPLSEIRLFVPFVILVFVSSILLSIRMYKHRRHIATLLLGVTPFIFILATVISDRLITVS